MQYGEREEPQREREHCVPHKLASPCSRAQASFCGCCYLSFLVLPTKLSDNDPKRRFLSTQGAPGGVSTEKTSAADPRIPIERPEQLKARVGGGAEDSRKHLLPT